MSLPMEVDKTELSNELKRRTEAMASMMSFTEYTFPEYVTNWHHKRIADALDSVLAGKIKRLMLFTPPRHGKTELVSKRFPAYVMGRNPDTNIIATSYSDDLARVNNRDVQRIITGEQYQLIFPNTMIGSTRTQKGVSNSDEFEVVGHRGIYKSSGIMGGITGRGFNIGIIDDPIKDRLEADSKTYRDRLWEWYTAVFYTRRANDESSIILVQTRWHHDDLAGRLLADNRADWEVITFEAIKEKDPDPKEAQLGSYDLRHAGEALWPDLFDRAALDEIKKTVGAFNFAALYQQSPVPRQGNMFKVEKIVLVDNIPYREIRRSIRYWDKAGSLGSGCLSAGVLIHELKNNMFLIADVVAGQWSALQREQHILQTARLDGKGVRIWCEQEPGSGGKESAEATVRNLRGFVIHADRVTGEKVSRAEPFAAQVEAGNVLCLNRGWTKDYLDELEMYPSGKFLDRTDASAGAFNKIVRGRISPHVGGQPNPGETMPEARAQAGQYDDILNQAKTPEERAELLRMIEEEGVKI